MAKNPNQTKRRIQKAQLSLKKMASDVKQPLAVMGGMVLGSVINVMLSKVFTKTQTVSGLKGIGNVSAFLKPVILMAGGLAGKQLIKNQIIKDVALGVASYGGAVAVQELINTPILSKLVDPNTTTTTTTTTGGLLGNSRTDYSKLPNPKKIHGIGNALPDLNIHSRIM